MSLPASRGPTADNGGMALEIPCPYCGTQMYAEHAHNRCPRCLYVEPCCDGAPVGACEVRVQRTTDPDLKVGRDPR